MRPFHPQAPTRPRLGPAAVTAGLVRPRGPRLRPATWARPTRPAGHGRAPPRRRRCDTGARACGTRRPAAASPSAGGGRGGAAGAATRVPWARTRPSPAGGIGRPHTPGRARASPRGHCSAPRRAGTSTAGTAPRPTGPLPARARARRPGDSGRDNGSPQPRSARCGGRPPRPGAPAPPGAGRAEHAGALAGPSVPCGPCGSAAGRAQVLRGGAGRSGAGRCGMAEPAERRPRPQCPREAEHGRAPRSAPPAAPRRAPGPGPGPGSGSHAGSRLGWEAPPPSAALLDCPRARYLCTARACCQMVEALLGLLILVCSSVSYGSAGGYTGIPDLGSIYYYQYGGAFSGFSGPDGVRARELDAQFHRMKLPIARASMAVGGALMALTLLLVLLGALRLPWRCPAWLLLECVLDVLLALGLLPALYFYFHQLQTVYASPLCKEREQLYQSKGYQGFSCSLHGADIAAGLFGCVAALVFALSAGLAVRGFRTVRRLQEKPAHAYEL